MSTQATEVPYLTDADLAELWGVPESRIARLRNQENWPHLRLGRSIRYAPEHVAAIERLHTHGGEQPSTGALGIPGQTARSAAQRGRKGSRS